MIESGAYVWIGVVAGTLTTAAFLPQAVKAWTTRTTGDLSLGMFLLLSAGIALWLAYGALIGDLPLMVANLITLVLAGAVLVAKLRFG